MEAALTPELPRVHSCGGGGRGGGSGGGDAGGVAAAFHTTGRHTSGTNAYPVPARAT